MYEVQAIGVSFPHNRNSSTGKIALKTRLLMVWIKSVVSRGWM